MVEKAFRLSRRKVLRATTVGIGGIGVSGNVAAKSSNEYVARLRGGHSKGKEITAEDIREARSEVIQDYLSDNRKSHSSFILHNPDKTGTANISAYNFIISPNGIPTEQVIRGHPSDQGKLSGEESDQKANRMLKEVKQKESKPETSTDSGFSINSADVDWGDWILMGSYEETHDRYPHGVHTVEIELRSDSYSSNIYGAKSRTSMEAGNNLATYTDEDYNDLYNNKKQLTVFDWVRSDGGHEDHFPDGTFSGGSASQTVSLTYSSDGATVGYSHSYSYPDVELIDRSSEHVDITRSEQVVNVPNCSAAESNITMEPSSVFKVEPVECNSPRSVDLLNVNMDYEWGWGGRSWHPDATESYSNSVTMADNCYNL